jgi:hypothetical protein
MSAIPLDFAALRKHLAGLEGPAYWRGVWRRWSQRPQAQALIDAEFPGASHH